MFSKKEIEILKPPKKTENIEVRHLTTMQNLVDFFELSPNEIQELVARYPFPDGQTLESFEMTPPEIASWFERAWIKKHPPRKIGQVFSQYECEILSGIRGR